MTKIRKKQEMPGIELYKAHVEAVIGKVAEAQPSGGPASQSCA